MHKVQRNTAIGLAATIVFIAVITLSPFIDVNLGRRLKDLFQLLHENGFPTWITYRRVEFTANIALLIPLGYLLGSLLPRPQLWIAYVALPVASTIIELIQWFAMPGRVGSVNDIVANSLGAWIGLTITVVIHGKNAERETSVGQKPLGGIS
ncbi:MAG: VanZ family protein [Ancrocorticia sp.]